MSIYALQAFQTTAKRMMAILELSGSPVGVRLLPEQSELPESVRTLNQYRYCQALTLARHGEHVLLDGRGIACPAAAAAFGFRPLPKELKSGKGLVGFGIVKEAVVGQKMFERMPRLEPGWLKQLHLYPLDQAEYEPDLVVVEDEVEKLMWIGLAYLNVTGGERVPASTAILQAACVDSTIIPYQEHRLNFSYGCYGCRDATDIGRNETVLGFPGDLLPAIGEHLDFLAQKAIPTSRSKRAWAAIEKREQEA
jgi:uncharacterized protein (DUF169 family)